MLGLVQVAQLKASVPAGAEEAVQSATIKARKRHFPPIFDRNALQKSINFLQLPKAESKRLTNLRLAYQVIYRGCASENVLFQKARQPCKHERI
jgi:hypothetical protein